MRARQAVVLCCCFLIWSGEQVSAVKEADLCRVWEHSKRGFQCPEWCARGDDRDCCHTCRLPFCCPRREAYPDWHRGRRALPKEAGAIPAPLTNSSVTDASTDGWIAFISVTMILVAIGLLFCCFKKRYRRWRRALRSAEVYRNWTAALYSTPQRQQFLFPGPSPPPYAEDPPQYSTEDPPQYSTEDPQRNITQPPPSPTVAFHCARAEDQEGEVTLQHLSHHQDVPGPSSEATLGTETSETSI